MKKLLLISVIALFVPLFAFSSPSLGSRLVGKILLAVEDRGRTYYVHTDGNRYQITKETALPIFQKLALGINNENLNEIPLADVGIDAEVAVVDTTPEITPQPVTLSCDTSSYLSQITSLTDELYKAKADIESYKKVIASNNLGGAVGVPVVEVKKELIVKNIGCSNNYSGVSCSIEIYYFENNIRKNADITISSDDGYFKGDGNLTKSCSGGTEIAGTDGGRMGNPITCPTGLRGKSEPSGFFLYRPLTMGKKEITVIANGITATTTSQGQVEKCVGKSGDDTYECNK